MKCFCASTGLPVIVPVPSISRVGGCTLLVSLGTGRVRKPVGEVHRLPINPRPVGGVYSVQAYPKWTSPETKNRCLASKLHLI